MGRGAIVELNITRTLVEGMTTCCYEDKPSSKVGSVLQFRQQLKTRRQWHMRGTACASKFKFKELLFVEDADVSDWDIFSKSGNELHSDRDYMDHFFELMHSCMWAKKDCTTAKETLSTTIQHLKCLAYILYGNNDLSTDAKTLLADKSAIGDIDRDTFMFAPTAVPTSPPTPQPTPR
jgi:hypothetical protein